MTKARDVVRTRRRSALARALGPAIAEARFERFLELVRDGLQSPRALAHAPFRTGAAEADAAATGEGP